MTLKELILRIPNWFWILLVAHGVILGTVAYLILLERKIASWVQDRLGPNRVGPFGLLQPIADGLKFILKEDYRPAGVDRVLFTIAPAIMIFAIIISIAVIPWGGIHQRTQTFDITRKVDASHAQALATAGTPEYEQALAASKADVPMNGTWKSTELRVQPVVGQTPEVFATITYTYPFQIAQVNIGVLFILAALSLAVYGVVIGGWASNNKYSFLGGLRATAQMISYEIPLGLSVLAIVLMYGSLDLGTIVDKQATYWLGWIPAWNVFTQPLGFLMFLVCIHAEANRAPFDLAEAEQELVGGYHTEYSAMRFALFFLAEYAGMITTSAVCVALFFGGWHLPWLEWLPWFQHHRVAGAEPSLTTSVVVCVVRSLVYFTKVIAIIFVFMWVRWTLPRFRFDQLMMLAWRAMIPISLAILIATTLVMYFSGPSDPRFLANGVIGGQTALVLLIVNIGMLIAIMVVSKFLPAAPLTNRRMKISGSRFDVTPLPSWSATTAAE
jgi:NADH-quinone oxidoreductase subunit H